MNTNNIVKITGYQNYFYMADQDRAGIFFLQLQMGKISFILFPALFLLDIC